MISSTSKENKSNFKVLRRTEERLQQADLANIHLQLQRARGIPVSAECKEGEPSECQLQKNPLGTRTSTLALALALSSLLQ